MNCAAFLEQVDDHLDGQLDEVRAQAWREHHASCAACRRIADGLAADHAAITAATRIYAERLRPHPGGQELLLRRIRTRSRWWWTGPAIAALLMVGVILAFLAHTPAPASRMAPQEGLVGRQEEPAHRLAELTALKAWQDDLARSLTATDDDRLWRLVACTYLPAGRVPPTMMTPASAAGEAPAAEPRTVVAWQRTTRRGDRTTQVDFQQRDDGSVHVEHRVTSTDEDTVTCLDAASWDLLVAGHGPLCRELGLVGVPNESQAGWPLPALGRLERDARLALQENAPSTGLARRLMALRLAPHVAAREELESAMRRILDQPLPSPTTGTVPSGPQVLEEIRRLEEATGATRLTTEEWHAAMRCLPAVRRGWTPGRDG